MADTQDNGRKSGLLGSLKSALGRLGGRGSKAGTPASPATPHQHAPAHEMTAVPVPEELQAPAPGVVAPAEPEEPGQPEQPSASDSTVDVDLAPIAPEDVPVVGAEAVSAEDAPSVGDETFVEAPGDPVVDASWTVARLRTLARERGVRGYSSMSKAQLLGELSSPQS